MASSTETEISGPPMDWYRATLIGALAGGVFWGLAAGVIYAAKASTAAVIAIVIAAAALVIVGALLFRRGGRPPTRAVGVGLVLAPLTGVAPVLAVWVLGVLSKAISWRG